MNYENLMEESQVFVLNYGPKLIGAILVWVIGSLIIKALVKAFVRMLQKSKTDASLIPFLKGVFGTVLKIMLVISALGMIGIEMTSFIAILGAAGLAIGMALSGTLQNFAGGVMLLVFRPFKVGDFIEAQGYSGTVHQIQIFNTILKTPDNKTIIIPNGGLSTSSMTNFSTEYTRRVDWTFGIGYTDDSDKAKQLIKEICENDYRIFQEPETFIAITELGDSSVNIVVRAWVDSSNYWGVHFDTIDKVFKTFVAEGINIPYPQMDVHVINQ